jgi:hypothetical protein
MKSIGITVTPARDANGRRRSGNRGPLFDVVRELVAGSPRPLLDAAQVLLAEGIDPATPLAMRCDGAAMTPCTRQSAQQLG